MSQPTENRDFPDPSHPPVLTDLPPVEAPSAGFIVQLFVIPAVIVAVVIVVWLLFGKLAGGERDAMEYVRLLRSPNAHWRAAYELASLIQNDPKLAGDPKLLGELSDLLGHDLDQDESPELTRYVALTLGAFDTLEGRAPNGKPIDPLHVLARALEPKQPAQVRAAAAFSLARHAARLEGKLDDPEAVKALARTADDEDPELRQIAVYALGFFGGPDGARALRDHLKDVDCYTRYNAAVALGRRGDPEARGVFREMLSSTDLNKIITMESATEKHSKIESIELEALQALQSSLDRRPSEPALAVSLRPEIVALSKSGLVGVRNRAMALLKSRALAEPAGLESSRP
jgi:hypothetical protein